MLTTLFHCAIIYTETNEREENKMALKATYHSGVERQDRIMKIATTIGFGEVYKQKHEPTAKTMKNLTDTGVVIITPENDTKKVITMYVATLAQAKTFFPDGKMPNWFYKIIQRNVKNGRIDYARK